MMKRKKRQEFERQELKNALLDIGVFVLFFIVGLVFIIIY
jgi:hypothetical protein